ncbi:MAG: hypothetical protein EB060_03775 [Proteobacteria bacterium]|nr:hypothetical protein [Pseudomonadota bacterium]
MLRFYMNGGVTRGKSMISYTRDDEGRAEVTPGEIVIRIITDLPPSQIMDVPLKACGFEPMIQSDPNSWSWSKGQGEEAASVEVVRGVMRDPSNMPVLLFYVPDIEAHALTLELDKHVIGGYIEDDEYPDIDPGDGGEPMPDPRTYHPGIQTHGKMIEGRISDAYLNLISREQGPDDLSPA